MMKITIAANEVYEPTRM